MDLDAGVYLVEALSSVIFFFFVFLWFRYFIIFIANSYQTMEVKDTISIITTIFKLR